MGKVVQYACFAAISARATRDETLTNLQFRVLMVIAAHDRLGRNGQCCWAGLKTLAQEVGCHPTNVSTALKKLRDAGYIGEARHKDDGRRKSYRIIYEAVSDAAVLKGVNRRTSLPKRQLPRPVKTAEKSAIRYRDSLPAAEASEIKDAENILNVQELIAKSRTKDQTEYISQKRIIDHAKQGREDEHGRKWPPGSEPKCAGDEAGEQRCERKR